MIIGAAFGKIVASLVEDIVMPLVGTLIGGVDFKSLAFQVGDGEDQVRQVPADLPRLRDHRLGDLPRGEGDQPPEARASRSRAAAPPRQEQLLEEIRDLLKKK